MAEPMHARAHARHPANRRPRIPHPHLAPPQRRWDEEPASAAPPDPPQPPHPSEEPPAADDWTAVDIPLVRSASRSRSRRGAGRPTPAERMLRSALHVGLGVNAAVLLASRLLPAKSLGGWSYGGDDFLLAAAVLLSGYALLAFGRLSRREDREA